MRAIFTMLILVSSLSANAWEIRNHYKDETKYTLLLRNGNVSELSTILGKEKRILYGVNLGRVVQLQADSLQTEIHNYLKAHYPNELSAALLSAGNMHNPKVTPLRKPFEEALVKSSYVQSIAEILYEHGYEVKAVTTEKFMLIERNKFDAMTWLKVEQITSKASRQPQAAPLL